MTLQQNCVKKSLLRSSCSNLQFPFRNLFSEDAMLSYLRLYSVPALMGMGWKTDVELWAKPEWKKFALDDITTNSIYVDSDLEYLENEGTKQYFKNYDLHCAAQRQFLGLLRVSIQGNPEVNRLMEPVFKRITAVDFLACGCWWHSVRS